MAFNTWPPKIYINIHLSAMVASGVEGSQNMAISTWPGVCTGKVEG